MSEERFVGHKLNQSPLSRAEADRLAHEPEPAAKALPSMMLRKIPRRRSSAAEPFQPDGRYSLMLMRAHSAARLRP
jgi:hypothetical protein